MREKINFIRVRGLIKHPRVYAIADLWDIPDLKELCRVQFEHHLTTLWVSDTFVDAGREAYSTTAHSDRKLRDLLETVAYKNLKNLKAKDDFKDLTKENAEFVSDVIRLRVAKGTR
ncbi:hypothetical protein RUND412_010778 [Rhizina undulata]